MKMPTNKPIFEKELYKELHYFWISQERATNKEHTQFVEEESKKIFLKIISKANKEFEEKLKEYFSDTHVFGSEDSVCKTVLQIHRKTHGG